MKLKASSPEIPVVEEADPFHGWGRQQRCIHFCQGGLASSGSAGRSSPQDGVRVNSGDPREKTRLLTFGLSPAVRAASVGEETSTFTFLGFTFHMGKTRKDGLRPLAKTSKVKLRRTMRSMGEFVRERRSVALEHWYPVFFSKVIGHLNYLGVSGNMRSLRQVVRNARRHLFYWLNRGSQNKNFTPETLAGFLERHPLPEARIVHRLYPAPRPA